MKTTIRKGNKSGCHGRKAYAHGGRVHAYADGGMVGNEADEFMDSAADQANMVDGIPVRQRLDRPAAKAPKSTSITINVGAPKAEVETPKVPPVVPPLPPMAGAPPPPMMPPAGGPPPGMPMRANGGRVEGSAKDKAEDKKLAKKMNMTMAEWEKSAADKKHDKEYANGGRIHKMTDKMAKGEGAGGGLGRLEKIKDYGSKAGKPAK